MKEPVNISSYQSYLEHERRLAPSTVKHYLRVLGKLLAFLGATYSRRIPWRRIDKDELVQFLIADLAGTQPSRPAWNNRVAALRTFFEWMGSTGVVSDNPASLILRVPTKSRPRLPLSFEEAIALVSAVREYSPEQHASRNVCLVQLLLHCGLRVSEAASINLSQVDLNRRVFFQVVTKGDERLSVAFNDVVAEAIEEYLPERAKIAPEGEDALFISALRQRWAVRSIEYIVSYYAKRAGIKRPVFPHLLRHSSATLLHDVAGAAPLVVKEHLGHKSIATTEIYLHPAARAHVEAVDRLGRAWQKATKGQASAKPRSSAVSEASRLA